MKTSRRALLGGLVSLLAGPAIVRVESLMALPAKAGLILPEGFGQTLRIRLPNDFIVADGLTPAIQETVERNSLLTINIITREAVKLFRNSNLFLQNIDAQEEYAVGAALTLDDYSERILGPMIDKFAEQQRKIFEDSIMHGSYGGGLAELLGATSPLE